MGPHQYKNDLLSSFRNRLEFLQCPKTNTILIFFPTGKNSDQVGLLELVLKDLTFDVKVGGLSTRCQFKYQILRISVNPLPSLSNLTGNGPVTIGYVLASTMYSVHWFVVKLGDFGSNSDSIRLVYVGDRVFKACCVVHACWSPHVPEESVVLLENGALFLFDLESRLRNTISNANFKGTRLKVLWDNNGYGSGNYRWLSCEFSWHPRVLIVARSDAIFLVDLRFNECSLTCLMNIELLHMYAPIEREQFRVLSKTSSDSFHFVLASDSLLLLCDVRKPLMPVLQWAHSIDKASYVDVFRLSELRSHTKDNTYKWPSDSGFCIILGSFWNCEFNIFSYGPSLPMPLGSVASKLTELRKCFYAWELPSDLLLSGRECHCGNCLLREEFLRDALPEWIDWQHKKEIVLGFGIVNKDFSSTLSEPDVFGGFTLIRLMSSGKLELQRYCASWDSIEEVEESHKKLLHFKDHLLYSPEYEEYSFPRRFKYIELDYLCGYLNGNLDEVLDAKMKKPCSVPQGKEHFSPEFHEILCKKLHECGFGQLRSAPATTIVLNDISLPASIHEVVLRRLWSELPMELLQLAFSNYTEILEVLVNEKRVALEFSAVPDLSQLPPFILRRSRKPSRSNKWSKKVQPGDALVGPVLPIPLLLTVHEFRNGCPNSEEQSGRFSVEAELSRRFDEVMQVASEMAFSNSEPVVLDDKVISLANDGEEKWCDSQRSKPFFLYQPVAPKGAATHSRQGKSLYEDDKFDTLISKVSDKKQTSSDISGSVGLELFDDLCTVELRFDACPMKFEPKEKRGYDILKKQLLEWQNRFDLYKDFRSRIESKSNI